MFLSFSSSDELSSSDDDDDDADDDSDDEDVDDDDDSDFVTSFCKSFFASLIVGLRQVLPVYPTASADSKPTFSSVGFSFFAVLLSASLALLSSDDDFGEIFACFCFLSAFGF